MAAAEVRFADGPPVRRRVRAGCLPGSRVGRILTLLTLSGVEAAHGADQGSDRQHRDRGERNEHEREDQSPSERPEERLVLTGHG